MNDPALVVRSLKYWACHVPMIAAGSFAVAYTSQWHGPQAFIGMLAGIGVFIALFTVAWSSAWFQKRFPTGSPGGRALLHGTRLRVCVSVALVLSVVFTSGPRPLNGYHPVFSLLMWPALPEMFAGVFAVGILQAVGRSAAVHSLRVMVAGPDAHQRASDPLVGDISSLLPTFLLTLIEGFFLTLLLLAFSAACRLVLKFRARQTPAHPAWNQPSPL